MSKKIIKLLSLLIAVVMMISVFAGCGKKEDKPDKESTEGTNVQQSSTTEEEDNVYVPTKDLELTIWNTQGTDVQAVEKPKEDIPGDWLAQKTKIKIKEFYGNGGQQWEPKLTTLIASGNLPNLVLTQGGQGPAHHAKLHEGDLNWELTPEMIQRYAPDVWENVPAYIWESIKVDGKIYGIPFAMRLDNEIDPNMTDDFRSAMSLAPIGNTIYIRDDILKMLIPTAMNYEEIMALLKERNEPIGDDLMLPIKTTEDYIKFMYDIKALGLKEGNKPVYAFGYNGGDNWIALSILGPKMLGYEGYCYTGWLNIPEKRMDFGYLNPVFKEAAKIQNKMINDKVIDPESLVHSAEKFTEKVMNGEYAMAAIGWIGHIDQVNSDLANAGKSFRFVPFYTQVPQKLEFPRFKEGPPSFMQALTMLKTLEEDEVIQVLNWINTMFTKEWEEIKYWGTKEAGLYEELSDGTRKFKDDKMQAFLVDLDLSAMDWKDAKGLNFNNMANFGGTPGFWEGVSKFENGVNEFLPQYFNKAIKYTNLSDAMKFPASSPTWKQEYVPVPNIQSWSAEYANIPEIQELWSKRATWDDPFKIAFTAKNEEDFNKKWDAAIENFKKTIDVDKMLEEQTKIMLPLLEKRTSMAK